MGLDPGYLLKFFLLYQAPFFVKATTLFMFLQLMDIVLGHLIY